VFLAKNKLKELHSVALIYAYTLFWWSTNRHSTDYK